MFSDAGEDAALPATHQDEAITFSANRRDALAEAPQQSTFAWQIRADDAHIAIGICADQSHLARITRLGEQRRDGRLMWRPGFDQIQLGQGEQGDRTGSIANRDSPDVALRATETEQNRRGRGQMHRLHATCFRPVAKISRRMRIHEALLKHKAPHNRVIRIQHNNTSTSKVINGFGEGSEGE
jgi:hypothetical protein